MPDTDPMESPVKFHVDATGRPEIVCPDRYAESIIAHLKQNRIPCGRDMQRPGVGGYANIITTTVESVARVKAVLKVWMIQNHTGDLASVK